MNILWTLIHHYVELRNGTIQSSALATTILTTVVPRNCKANSVLAVICFVDFRGGEKLPKL